MNQHITKLQSLMLGLIIVALAVLIGVMIGQLVSLYAQPQIAYLWTVTPPAATLTATASPTAAATLSTTPVERATGVPPIPTWTPTFTPTPVPTPTSTPIPPTPTLTPSIVPTPLPPRRPTAVPIEMLPTQHPSDTLRIPTPVARYHIPEDAITIVVLGSDQRPDWRHWNTDVIQYVVIYPDIPSVSILSIPRDLYVYVPNFHMMRINQADMYGELHGHDGGGLGLLNQTMLYNLGITADYYVKVNFEGLIEIVNIMGGIDVPVHCYVEDYWPYPNEDGSYSRFALEPGLRHLDGREALWYSRTRKTTSVFDRERRQQQVLEALWRKAKETNLLNLAPTLAQDFSYLYQTDLGMGNIIQLALVAAQLERANIRTYNIGGQEVTYYTTYQGGNVFLLKHDETQAVIDAAISKPATNRAFQNPIYVEVWNGTPYADWDWLAADRMVHYGFIPLSGTPDRHDYAQTQIIFFGETTKGSGLETLQSLFGVRGDAVIYPGEVRTDIKMRLIIGQDYDTCPYR